MRAVTLSELITRVRRMSDTENSQFVTDTEIIAYINEAITELYDLLVANADDEWGTYPFAATISVTAGTSVYNLPDACYKLRGIDRLVSGVSGSSTAQWEEIDRVAFGMRNARSDLWYDDRGARRFGYRPLGATTVAFLPTPQQAETLRVWYVPAVGTLSEGTDQLDGVNGWEEYVVVDAAIKCMLKEESDPSQLVARRARLAKRIEDMSEERDVGQPDTIQDVRGGWWPYGGPYFRSD